MMRWLAIGAGAVALGLAMLLIADRSRNAELQLVNASLQRSVNTLERERDQAREARAVTRAELQRVADKAREYDSIREAILRGEDDADLPDWFCEHLGLLGFVCAAN